ncbi:hypothetical protein [Paenibacillus kribbensis]|uniref:hypothetical protein n=1 Tax=Paenibacillus kribbensis TaxID=172713 RepID=UPI00083892C0|nr:hypothetical protein [Paenibacillus kribbensis]
MTIQRSSNLLLNNASRRLKKVQRFLVKGKYKRAKKNIIRSVAILSRVLVRLNNFREAKHRKNRGRSKNE